jgi:acetyl esterase/lipase
MKLPLVLAFALLAGRLGAQSVEEFPLRAPTAVTGPTPVEEISYRLNSPDDRGFNRAVQKVGMPTVTLYRPAKSTHRNAAVIICPGGGYSYLTIDREGHAVARYFQAQGLAAIVLKYRLPQANLEPGAMPHAQEDGLEAVKLARGRAAEWGIDPKRIGILGFSAGGHLAGSVGILGDAAAGTRPDFVAPIYPVVCMEGQYVHQGSRVKLIGASPTPERIAEFSLEKRARAGLPPYFLAHARDDRGVPPQNSELLAAALKEKGVPVELMFVATGGHGFGLGTGESARWREAFLAWLDKLP